jgi:hypothetical protein
MTRTVSAAEAKAHFSDHLRASERGVTCRHGGSANPAGKKVRGDRGAA